MRRRTVIFVMIFMCSVLVACGNKQKAGTSDESKNNSADVSTKTEAVSARQRKALIAANSYCSYAINKDGKIVSTKYTGMEASAPDIEKFGTVSYIQAYSDILCGMDDNGRMYGDGAFENCGESTLEYYDDARQIISANGSFVMLTDDGKLKSTHKIKSGWLHYISLASDVDYIESSGTLIACLKNDRTVTIYTDEENGARDSKEWKDIVDIACGYGYVVGLKSDGTVVAAGDNTYGQCNVSDWKDIVEISAYELFTVGLKSDGTVVAVGDNTYGQCNVNGWKDIVAVVCGSRHTLGLKADGTLVAVGSNEYGQCDVEEINNLKTPFD